MKWLSSWGGRIAAMNENRGGPWGSGGSGGGDGGSGGGGDGGDGGPRSPWGRPGPRRRRPAGGSGPGEVTSLDDWLRRSRDKIRGGLPGGGGTGGTGGGMRRSYWLYGIGALVVLWIVFTSFHPVGAGSRGVVTTFGRYDRTMNPGVGLTWPAPISRVEMVQVEEIREIPIPGGDRNRENLILTGDQNVIDLDYTVRWNIKDPQLYLFTLRDPNQTIREAAETSMRAVIARVSLDDALGQARGDIANRVQQNMQQLLDEYRSGIQVQGVAVNQSQPPTAVNDAFLEVSAAQQKAQSAQNEARAYALQLTARAQGDAAQFDQIYQQYKLAPEVTRRRMYYETMEEILSRVDTTIIEAPGVTPYLPLPEVRNRQQQQQPVTPQVQQGQAR
ncbi:MAG TPA: protease modulator HflK [Allosphingosinicella sp.]|jgi:membrane protease subunit HflK|nr:protease modulator HflK [Allosphingosinicella sp.]